MSNTVKRFAVFVLYFLNCFTIIYSNFTVVLGRDFMKQNFLSRDQVTIIFPDFSNMILNQL